MALREFEGVVSRFESLSKRWMTPFVKLSPINVPELLNRLSLAPN
jgi:hypothetical protein